jgi:ribosomal protein S14
MLSKVVKDNKFRELYKKQELSYIKKKFVLKYLLFESNFFRNVEINSVLLLYFSKVNFSKKMSKTKIVRRCTLTHRSRVNSRRFNISRILLRELLQIGIIPGYKKSVW